MEVLRWLLPVGLSFLTGVLFVRFLTVHPLIMSRYLFGATLALVAVVISAVVAFEGQDLVVGIPVAFASALAGYALVARRVLSREDTRQLPELKRPAGEPGLGHTAVIYFAHGEPETYDPIGWINQFKELDEQNIRFVPFLARPFFLYRLRNSYLRVGRSDHRRMHFRMLRSLERAFREDGDAEIRFYISFLDDDPRPDTAVIQALNEGASRIIVSEVFLTISNHTAEGKELIEEVGLQASGIPIAFTGPLYDSETLRRMFVHRANAHVGDTPKAKVGILLVGHGQPDEWDVEWPTETQQELAFRRDVLGLLEQDGYKSENLSLAWMEFKEPKPAPKVEEFSRSGVEKVLYFSAAISADALHSQYDVPDLVNRACVRDGFPLINLGAWNDDPLVIRAIKEKIDARMKT